MLKYTALIVAAGAGTRMGLGYNKVYYRMQDGRTILEHTMDLFLRDSDCEEIVVVTDSEDYYHCTGQDTVGRVVLVQGGSTRRESVRNGLFAVLSDTVFVHDGARPFLPAECLQKLKETMETEDAACLMVPCKDTIKIVSEGQIEQTLPRSTLMAAQTPQAFRTALLVDCMEKAEADGFSATDDCSVVEAYSDRKIRVVEGSYANRKITTAEDL